jgi:hypothetical protein
MRHWHRQFLGRPQLPTTLSALAISEFFTLEGVEVRAVLSRYGMDMRLGSALQIGFLKMCGRPLDKLQRVPIPVLEHLSTQIGGAPPEIATLRALYGKRRQTLFDHQQFALGGSVYKKRVPLPGRGKRGGARILVATKHANRWFLLYGFGKNEQGNIDDRELAALCPSTRCIDSAPFRGRALQDLFLGQRDLNRPYVAGEDFTVADILMTTVLREIRKTDLIEPFSVLKDYFARCQARPAWQRTLRAYEVRMSASEGAAR